MTWGLKLLHVLLLSACSKPQVVLDNDVSLKWCQFKVYPVSVLSIFFHVACGRGRQDRRRLPFHKEQWYTHSTDSQRIWHWLLIVTIKVSAECGTDVDWWSTSLNNMVTQCWSTYIWTNIWSTCRTTVLANFWLTEMSFKMCTWSMFCRSHNWC